MFDWDVKWNGLDDLNAHMRRVTGGLSDLAPVVNDIALALTADNIEGRLAGEDKYGQALIPVKPETAVRRNGPGPPLVPEGSGAKLVVGFRIETERHSGDKYSIRGIWTGAPWLKYHIDGPDHSKYLPIRDPVGVRPAGIERVNTIVRDYAFDLLMGRR
jgi:hypothetical protein